MIKAFAISLKRRSDRHEYIKQNYTHSNLYNLEIIDAYDGKIDSNNSNEYINLKNNFLNSINNNRNKTNPYNYLSINEFTPGELGCFLSHIIIWKKMINENITNALIFEDDCIFNINFSNKLESILKQELPLKFNILWLGGKMVDNYENTENTLISQNIAIKNEIHPFGAFSYILNIRCAETLLKWVFSDFRGKLGVDYFMDEFLKNNNFIQHMASPFITYSISCDDSNSIFKTDIR
jgi:glycosyl transferase family 25